jgi:hypothetical protein
LSDRAPQQRLLRSLSKRRIPMTAELALDVASELDALPELVGRPQDAGSHRLGDRKRSGEPRRIWLSVLFAGVLASATPLSAAAVTGSGYVYGPWSCPPDYYIGMTFYVAGSSGSYVGIEISYMDAGDAQPSFMYTNIYPGWQSRYPYPRTRTIYKFGYVTHGNANLQTWLKRCNEI